VNAPQPTFFYDLGNPECYLAAEQVNSALGVVPEWEPVLESALGAPPRLVDIDGLARRVEAAGMQPLRWPAGWPPDTRQAMLAARYAKHIGRAVAFSLAAFRQAFAGGRDLGDEATVLIAAAACEMHPAAVLKGVALRSVQDGLEAAVARAAAAGATTLPAIAIGGQTFCGADAVQAAADALGAWPA
jgi:2-hydroxychromene-2-carboxylate isomerase